MTELTAPPGYGKLVLLDRVQHARLGLRKERSLRWCASLNSVYLHAAELSKAALDYPVGFVRGGPEEGYFPVAVLGLRERENLFVDGQGRWQPNAYVPAYVRRHPFCVAYVRTPDNGAARQIICVQEDQLAANGEALFDAKGEPTASWAPWRQLIDAVEGAQAQTRDFMQRLAALDLLVPFDAVAVPKGGSQLRLNGLYRIDEQKLNALDPSALRPLLERGELRVVYAHLLSLERFATLLDLTAQRDGRRNQTH